MIMLIFKYNECVSGPYVFIVGTDLLTELLFIVYYLRLFFIILQRTAFLNTSSLQMLLFWMFLGWKI